MSLPPDVSSAKLYENLRNMGAMFAFSNLAVPPRAMSQIDVSQRASDHSAAKATGGQLAAADQRPTFHRSDMFLERSPTLATVGSAGSAVSRAGTMGGGGGGSVSRKILGPARSELRIIENHQHDNYATVSGGSLGSGSDGGRADRDPSTANSSTLLQLQDLVRSRQQPSQRPSLQSMFSAQGSLLQLESTGPPGGLLQDGGGGGCSLQNLKQGGGSFDEPSPYSTLKKRKVSQPSPLPPPPPPTSKLAYSVVSPKPHEPNSPTGDLAAQRIGGGGGATTAPHPLQVDNSYGMSPPPTAVSDSSRLAAVANACDLAATVPPAVALHR